MKTTEQKKTNRIALIILIIILVGGIGFGGYWFINSIRYVSTDDAAVDDNHVSVSSKMLGRIASLTVDEGAKVEARQLLVQLDATDLHAQEAQATAALNSAKQSLILAKVNLDKTKDDFARAKMLFDSGSSSKEDYDHAVKALDIQNVQYSIAQTQIDNAMAQLGVIETQLLNTRIYAPITGVIAKRLVLPGEVVQPGQAIFTIYDLTHVWITANYEETKIRKVRVNEPVNIVVDAYPYRQFKGRVIQIGADIIPPPLSIGDSTKTTQKIPVKILFEQIPDSVKLVPGMSVETYIKIY